MPGLTNQPYHIIPRGVLGVPPLVLVVLPRIVLALIASEDSLVYVTLEVLARLAAFDPSVAAHLIVACIPAHFYGDHPVCAQSLAQPGQAVCNPPSVSDRHDADVIAVPSSAAHTTSRTHQTPCRISYYHQSPLQ